LKRLKERRNVSKNYKGTTASFVKRYKKEEVREAPSLSQERQQPNEIQLIWVVGRELSPLRTEERDLLLSNQHSFCIH